MNTDFEIKQHILHIQEINIINNLSQDELKAAEIILIKQAQQEEYWEEILALQKTKKNFKTQLYL